MTYSYEFLMGCLVGLSAMSTVVALILMVQELDDPSGSEL